MFDIFADEIVFEGRTVAIMALREGTLRAKVEEALEGADPDLVYTDEEYVSAVDAAENKGVADFMLRVRNYLLYNDDILSDDQAVKLLAKLEDLV